MQGASSPGLGPSGKASVSSLELPLLPVAAQQGMSSTLCLLPSQTCPSERRQGGKASPEGMGAQGKILAPEIPVVSATPEGMGQVIKSPLMDSLWGLRFKVSLQAGPEPPAPSPS